MTVRIVTDSASDVTQQQAAEWGIDVLPLTTVFAEGAYRDGVDITHEQFFEKLIESDELPTTSQATPGQYAEAFNRALANGDQVVCITLSSALSGCHASAVVAREQLLEPLPGSDAANGEGGESEGAPAGDPAAGAPDAGNPAANVFIVDSLNACLGQAILVEYAVRLRDAGETAANIAAELEQARGKIRLVALLDTLEYLRKGGRISAAAAFAGQLLSIKPVIAIDENGAIVVLGKARGSKNGNNLLNKLVMGSRGINFSMPYTLAYSGLSDVYLRKYIRDSAHLYPGIAEEDLPVISIGSTIGTHVGPGAIALAYFEN